MKKWVDATIFQNTLFLFSKHNQDKPQLFYRVFVLFFKQITWFYSIKQGRTNRTWIQGHGLKCMSVWLPAEYLNMTPDHLQALGGAG